VPRCGGIAKVTVAKRIMPYAKMTTSDRMLSLIAMSLLSSKRIKRKRSSCVENSKRVLLWPYLK
jgi:hypothetical protein